MMEAYFGPLLVSMVGAGMTGAFASYVTGTRIIAQLSVRQDQLERDIAQIQAILANVSVRDLSVVERITRVETKLDLLLARKV